MSQGRIAALDGLRGIAAVLVVLHHLPVWSPELNFQVLRNGHLMVPVFFVLSGFVIARTYGSQIHNGADLVRFQWRRVVRLYPVHLVMLLAFLLVEVAKLWAQGQGIVSPSTRAFRENSPTALLQHLLLIQSVGPTGHPLTFNAPAWSISAELWTYLTFGAVALLLQLHRVTAFALMAVGAALMVLLAPESGWNPMARCFAGFFLGAMLAEVRPRLPPPIAPAALVGLILVMTFSSGEATADLIAVALAGFTVAGLDGDAPVARVFEAKALQLLGSVSYSLYMGHALVVWIVNQVARLVLGGPELMVSGLARLNSRCLSRWSAGGWRWPDLWDLLRCFTGTWRSAPVRPPLRWLRLRRRRLTPPGTPIEEKSVTPPHAADKKRGRQALRPRCGRLEANASEGTIPPLDHQTEVRERAPSATAHRQVTRVPPAQPQPSAQGPDEAVRAHGQATSASISGVTVYRPTSPCSLCRRMTFMSRGAR